MRASFVCALLLVLATVRSGAAVCAFSRAKGDATYAFDYSASGTSGADFYLTSTTPAWGMSPCSWVTSGCGTGYAFASGDAPKLATNCVGWGTWATVQATDFIDSSRPFMGLILTASGGADGRSVRLKMYCSSGSPILSSVTSSGTVAEFSLYSPAGCATGGYSPSSTGPWSPDDSTGTDNGGGSSSSSAMSGGWAFIIFIIVSVAAYLLVGGAIMHYKFGANGKAMIPNLSFWQTVPTLVRDGCMFSYVKVRELIGKPLPGGFQPSATGTAGTGGTTSVDGVTSTGYGTL